MADLPDSLFLSDRLMAHYVQYNDSLYHKAAAELRRLYAENQSLRDALVQAEPDHETRAELAEQQVVQFAEERDHYRNLWQKAQQAEPVAWMFELARNFNLEGYGGWEKRITEYLPNTPEGSVRNVTPLYTAPPPQQQAEPVQKSGEFRVMVCGVDCHPGDQHCNGYCTGKTDDPPEATAEQQAEPVGAVLVNRESREGVMFYSVDMIPDPATLKDRFELVKVYTAPPQRKPLTDEEIDKLMQSIGLRCADEGNPLMSNHAEWQRRTIARAIERAHGIKEAK